MSSVFVCCLALLHALSLTVSSLAVRREEMVGAVRAYEAVYAQWTTATDRTSDEGVRVPQRAAVLVSVRALPQLPIGRGAGAPVHRVELASEQISTARELFGRGTQTHHVASRGAVLPYFPTAPPRRA